MICFNIETRVITSYFHRLPYIRLKRARAAKDNYLFFDFVPWQDAKEYSAKEWCGWKLVSMNTKEGGIVKIVTPTGREILERVPSVPNTELLHNQHEQLHVAAQTA